MRRAAAALGALPPRARVQADWIPSSVQTLFESCQRIQSLRSVTVEMRRFIAVRGCGSVPARCQQSMHSISRSAHQQASASTSSSAAAVAATSGQCLAARHAWHQVSSRGFPKLPTSATARIRGQIAPPTPQTALLRAALHERSFSAAYTAVIREYSKHGVAAAARAYSNSAAAITTASRGGGAQMAAALPAKGAQQSRQLMSASGGSLKGATGGAARGGGGPGKRKVLHPTAILAARSSRHFASWGQMSRSYNAYEPSNFRVLLRRSLDPQTVLYTLIGINVVVFLWWRVNPAFMERHFVTSLSAVTQGRPYTLLTSAVSQQDTMHLLGNMVGLFFFGREVGRAFGGRALLALYVAGGIGGGAAHCLWRYWQIRDLPYFYRKAALQGGGGGALGASAAVNAIMVVNVLLYPMQTVLVYGILPMPMVALGALWLYADITGTLKGSMSGVGHVAHLGGALTGALFYGAFKRGYIRPRGYW